jgi:hypothetical protein
MDIGFEKSRKKQSKYLILIIIIMVVIPFIINKFSMSQIDDTNGSDTAIVSFDIESYKNGDKCVGYESSTTYSGSSSKKNADINTEADYDTVCYTSEKFSGMKVIQETEVTGPVSFSISSKIDEGNFEVAVYKDNVCLKVFGAGDNATVSFSDTGIYTVVIGGESAKGTVTVQRRF